MNVGFFFFSPPHIKQGVTQSSLGKVNVGFQRFHCFPGKKKRNWQHLHRAWKLRVIDTSLFNG